MLREEVSSSIAPMIIAVMMIVGCGGTTTGTEKPVDVGSGGHSSVGGSNNGTGGSLGAGGVTGASGGGACNCPATVCTPGTHVVSVLGQCCPVCEPCGAVNCPSQMTDAGACPLTPVPACSRNSYPPCAPDWSTAQSWFPGCGFGSGSHLGRCGPYNAVVVTGFDNGNTYFYGTAGKLIGSQNSYSCEAYDPSFVPLTPLALNGCSPLDSCPADGGTVGSADAGRNDATVDSAGDAEATPDASGRMQDASADEPADGATACVPGACRNVGPVVEGCGANGQWSFVCPCGMCSGGSGGVVCGGSCCTPGTAQCSGNGVQRCDAAGSWGAAVACSNSACVSGACTGVCAPGSTQCSGNGVQTCTVNGTWAMAVACPSQACVMGACTGVCTPGAAYCDAVGCNATLHVCDWRGQWGVNNAAFPSEECFCYAAGPGGGFTCSSATCSCTAGATTCSSGNAVQTCSGTTRHWGVAVPCVNQACVAGACVGVCSPPCDGGACDGGSAACTGDAGKSE